MIHRGALLVSMSHDFGNCEPHQNILDVWTYLLKYEEEEKEEEKEQKKEKKRRGPCPQVCMHMRFKWISVKVTIIIDRTYGPWSSCPPNQNETFYY